MDYFFPLFNDYMQMISSDCSELNIKRALLVAAGRRWRRTVWPCKINVLRWNVYESISACKLRKIKLTPMFICLPLAHEGHNQPLDSTEHHPSESRKVVSDKSQTGSTGGDNGAALEASRSSVCDRQSESAERLQLGPR